jgi:hypothetical protein
MQVKLMIARFPFQNQECPDTTDWLLETVLRCKQDPRISEVLRTREDDTPITMTRNKVLKQAIHSNVDYVLMVDSDMKPDLVPGQDFFPRAFDFALQHNGPCVIGAPYCGPPPLENIYVFRWATWQSDHPNQDIRIEQYTREEAAIRAGFEEVAALPTGLILIAMEGVKRLTPPWFDYEWADPPYNTQKASTEDVFFTRNLSLLGVPQYVFWDAWAGHWKRKCVGRPRLWMVDEIREEFVEAVRRDQKTNERIIDVACGLNFARNGKILPRPVRPVESYHADPAPADPRPGRPATNGEDLPRKDDKDSGAGSKSDQVGVPARR